MTLRPWIFHGKHELLKTAIFRLFGERWQSPRTGAEHTFTVIESPDWVNVVALDTQGNIILIRQFRFGTGEATLEVPGGMIDPNESPRAAAERELREESGYRAARFTDLGFIYPNPAIQNNKAYMFLAEDCEREGELALDAGEDIEVVSMPLEQALELLRRGHISHALVAVALQRFEMLRRGELSLG